MGPENKAEITQQPEWQSAYIGHRSFGHRSYSDDFLVLLTTGNDPSKKIYGVLGVSDSQHVSIKIPTKDRINKETLRNDAYLESTVWGEIDNESYLRFATEKFVLEKMLALLNSESADSESRFVSDWFYEQFGIDHGKVYGLTRVSSSGHDDTFNIKLEDVYNPDKETSQITPLEKATEFVRNAQNALPQIKITPLSTESYLNDLYNSLQFLPRDWK